jgi:D-sedoheptulose 7-phosphate isomerase
VTALAAAAIRMARESSDVKREFFDANAERVAACAEAMARAFDAGARLFTLGNGGSACDAAHAAVEFSHPTFEKRPPIAATSLANDAALITAIGNDDDFALAFARPLALLSRRGDVVLGLSTSGQSASVVRAMKAARELGALTVGLTGRDGGKLVDLCDHAFVVPSFSIHRIQEVHVTLLHVLWELVHVARGEEELV